MKAFDENSKFIMDEVLDREHVESAKNGMMFLPLEAEKLQKVYPTEEKCALWLFPYRNIDLTKLLIKRKRKNDKNFDPDNPEIPTSQDDDAAIISNVMHFSPRPQFIRDAASAFVADVIGTWDMVAMHWRYDESDFMVHCQKGAGNTDKCDQLADVDPQVVAKNLAIYSNSVRSYGRYDAKIVYIAAPPSELELILKLKATIVEKLSVKVFTFEDVDSYLKNKFEGCAPIMDYYHDFVSLVEMEICSNAGSFVRSDASSWSKNIHLERLVRKKTRHDKPNEILISDDWTPDYWHPINEHILESLAKNADEEAKINAERAEAGYAARNLADLAKKELEARKNGKVAGRIVHDENEKLKHEK